MKKKNNQIDKSWVEWAGKQVNFLMDGGYLIFPADGAIFQINKIRKTITLVCCRPEFLHPSSIELTNQKVFAAINYRYVKGENIPISPDAIIDEIFGNLQKYSSDIPTLLHGIGVIFQLKNEAEDDAVLLNLIEKKGKKLPINPVTIRGDGNFTASRLWIGVDSIPDAPRRFNPSYNPGPRWDKPVTILLWKEGQSLSVDDPNRAAMIVDEADFISLVKELQNCSLIQHIPQLKLWGQFDRTNEHQKMFILFEKAERHVSQWIKDSSKSILMTVKLYRTSDDYQENYLVGEVSVDLDKFIDGLGHLFPNGELS